MQSAAGNLLALPQKTPTRTQHRNCALVLIQGRDRNAPSLMVWGRRKHILKVGKGFWICILVQWKSMLKINRGCWNYALVFMKKRPWNGEKTQKLHPNFSKKESSNWLRIVSIIKIKKHAQKTNRRHRNYILVSPKQNYKKVSSNY